MTHRHTPRHFDSRANMNTNHNSTQQIDRALIIDEPWISKILLGSKIWEMRSTPTKIRGTNGLISKGSGKIVATASLEDCTGPLSDAEVLRHQNRHHVPLEMIGKWRHAWVLSQVLPLESPLIYVHPNGAVICVKLDGITIPMTA